MPVIELPGALEEIGLYNEKGLDLPRASAEMTLLKLCTKVHRLLRRLLASSPSLAAFKTAQSDCACTGNEHIGFNEIRKPFLLEVRGFEIFVTSYELTRNALGSNPNERGSTESFMTMIQKVRV